MHELILFTEDYEISWQHVKSCSELLQAYTVSFPDVEGFPRILWDCQCKRAVLDLDGRLYVARSGALLQLHDCPDCGTTVGHDEWHEEAECCEPCFDEMQHKFHDRFRKVC